MSWSAITEAEIVTHISGDELEALRAAALADGQEDPVDPSITQVTDEVRGYVAGTLLGVLIFGIIQTAIIFDGRLSSWWTRIAIGVLLLAFILLQRLLQRVFGTARG